MKILKRELHYLTRRIRRGLSSYHLDKGGSEIPLINVRDVSNGRINAKSVGHIKVKKSTAVTKSQIEAGDIVVTLKGSARRAACATEAVTGYAISANLIAFTLNDEILPELVAAYLNSPHGQAELQSRAAGVAQMALNLKSLMEIPIPVPTLKEQRLLANYLSLAEQHDSLLRREGKLLRMIVNGLIQDKMLR